MVGDTSPACVDCGHSFGGVETCEECKGPIPRTMKSCPRCSPKILQYMGLKAPPKKKKEEPKKPERPKPPMLNQPRPPAGPVTPPPRAAASKDDFLEGEATELRKAPYTPAPRKGPVRPPGPSMDHRPDRDLGAERRAAERKIHWGAVLLGLLVAGIGSAGYFYYLPRFGIDPRLLPLIPIPADSLKENAPFAAAMILGLGVIEILRGFLARPRKIVSCRFCKSEVAAFKRAFSLRCENCGKRIGARLLNGAIVLVLWLVVLGAVAGVAMVQTGFGLPK